jgi:tRNA-specific 2-thiouridylase
VLFIEKNEIHLIESGNFFKSDTVKKLQARIRYRQPLQDVALYFKTEGVFLLFKNEQLAITRGQFAVWYKNDELIGSGVID